MIILVPLSVIGLGILGIVLLLLLFTEPLFVVVCLWLLTYLIQMAIDKVDKNNTQAIKTLTIIKRTFVVISIFITIIAIPIFFNM